MWGPRFTHNISLFYPEAILNFFGVYPSNPVYPILIARIRLIIEEEVLSVANRLNELIKSEFHKDILDIEEYSVLGEYWLALESALSNPLHVGVTWGPKLVQAKFIDTDLLGGWKELQEVQHIAYPSGAGNLRGWVDLYTRWKLGYDDRIGETLQRRISIMLSLGIAPFAQAIEEGNMQYDAYPHHGGKYTLETFKPTYRRLMNRAYHKVVSMVEAMILNILPQQLLPMSVEVDKTEKSGLYWTSKTGNRVFLLSDSLRTSGGKLVGSGYILSSSGSILKKWYGWLPK